jgi:hypothetical protein
MLQTINHEAQYLLRCDVRTRSISNALSGDAMATVSPFAYHRFFVPIQEGFRDRRSRTVLPQLTRHQHSSIDMAVLK